jgi:hypothetical protein
MVELPGLFLQLDAQLGLQGFDANLILLKRRSPAPQVARPRSL